MKHIAWLVALLAACTDFESIDRGVCGNGLLEAGEDCDSSDVSCASCAVTCATVADCPTTDYVCGIDHRCHAPGGALSLPRSAGMFSADDMRITDIDDDGIGDALGVTQTSMIIRYGDEASQLDQFTSIITPTQTGASAFGDLDNDGSLDVAITTPDGLVGYASPYGVLAPIPVHELLVNETGMPFDLDRMFAVSANMYAAFAIDPTYNALVMVVVDGQAPDGVTDEYYVVPCAGRIQPITSAEFETAEIRVYNVHKRNEKQLDMLFSIQAGSGASRKTCIISLHRDEPPWLQPYRTITLDDVTPTLLATAAPIVLADLDFDTDRCPGLVRTDGGPAGLKYVDGEFLNNRCQFVATAPSNLPAMPTPPGTKVIGSGPVDPQVPFVSADVLITSEGVYPHVVFYGFVGAYHTNRRITEFGTGDIDGNGTVDLVFGSAGEEELDLLYRVEAEAGFNLVRLDTASTVVSVTVGDYDGNGIDDIAFAEQREDHMRLMVSYGTTDRPLAPVSMGNFAAIERVSRINFGDSVDLAALADDLVVFQPPLPNSSISRVTFLHGNPQRVMLSYFDPRLDSFQQNTLFRGSVIGDFTNSAGSSTHADLLAVAPARVDADSNISGVRAWRVAGTVDGLDATKTDGVSLAGLNDCSFTNATGLCLDLARYLAFPTATDHDIVIGVDRVGGAMMIDPWVTSATVTATSLSALAALIPAKSVPRSLHAADLDGDTAPELVVALAPALGSGTAGAIIVCSMSSGGVATDCDDLVPAIKDAAAAAGSSVAQCYDATPARLSYRGRDAAPASGLDLVVACRGDDSLLFRVTRTANGNVITQLAIVGDAVSSLRAGDVTGDGIDDLVLITGDQSASLTVYRQCTNRDLDCLGGNP